MYHFLLLLALSVCTFGHVTSRSIDEIIGDAGNKDDHIIPWNATRMADGTILAELDVKFTAQQWEAIKARGTDEKGQYKAINDPRFLWPSYQVPYKFAREITMLQKAMVLEAMEAWETLSCLKFRPAVYAVDYNYLYITSEHPGCTSFIGMIGGKQPLNLGPECYTPGVLVHEIGHALGLYHEHQRQDRDKYVTIDYNNVNSKYEGSFRIINNMNTLGVTYDYGSIMHYGAFAHSKSNGRTIITKDPAWQDHIGLALVPTIPDGVVLSLLYRCDKMPDSGEGTSTEATVPPPGECADLNDSCQSWKGLGYCTCCGFQEFMKTECPESCGYCCMPRQAEIHHHRHQQEDSGEAPYDSRELLED